ncbi:MAG: VWA domain-containing protein [Planctomycetaceae bacterium]
MIASLKALPAFVVSLLVHLLILAALLLIPFAIEQSIPEVTLETIFNEERDVVDYDQETAEETDVSENLTFTAGGTVSTSIGANAQPVAAQVKVAESTALQEPNLNPSLNDISIPTESSIIKELGEGQVTGETGAMVEGYGAAMHRLSAEILRMMHEKKTVVVWLFDESGSMKDDQKEIRDNFHKIYAELGIAQKQVDGKQKSRRRRGPEALQTVICSYGASVTDRTNPRDNASSKPTANLDQIRAAIDSIPIDPSGAENMCSAIVQVCKRYASFSRQRKLAFVVVTDESGDDGIQVDAAIQAARAAKAPIYVLGRESMFGYPYTRQDWTHEETGLVFQLRIRRGPETAFPECLQWDGIHERWDAYGSGFGPYEQVRLARDTGGIFFQLPGKELDLTRPGANEKRKFDALAMKIYQPLLLPRRVYKNERDNRPFRNAVFKVISGLNPTENKLLFDKHNPELNMRRWHFPIANASFREQAANEVVKAVKAMLLVNEGIGLLESVTNERALEESQRWRAGYDLAYAQLIMFRLRLYQYLLALDDHANTGRMPKDKKSNEWNLHNNRKSIIPNADQFSRIKSAFGLKQSHEEYLAMVKAEEDRCGELLKEVIVQHPGTPWSRRAEYELGLGFGHQFREGFRDPRYQSMRAQIKLPNL